MEKKPVGISEGNIKGLRLLALFSIPMLLICSLAAADLWFKIEWAGIVLSLMVAMLSFFVAGFMDTPAHRRLLQWLGISTKSKRPDAALLERRTKAVVPFLRAAMVG